MRKSVEKNIILKLSEEFSKNGKATTLIISPDNYTEYIKWDCKNQCLYHPDFTNPPDIMGLKVKIRKGKNVLKVL